MTEQNSRPDLSDLEGNPFYEYFAYTRKRVAEVREEIVKLGNPESPHFRDFDAINNLSLLHAELLAEMQSLSTFALAYEQRTHAMANLFVAPEDSGEVASLDYSRMSDELKNRLGQ